MAESSRTTNIYARQNIREVSIMFIAIWMFIFCFFMVLYGFCVECLVWYFAFLCLCVFLVFLCAFCSHVSMWWRFTQRPRSSYCFAENKDNDWNSSFTTTSTYASTDITQCFFYHWDGKEMKKFTQLYTESGQCLAFFFHKVIRLCKIDITQCCLALGRQFRGNQEYESWKSVWCALRTHHPAKIKPDLGIILL